MRRTLANLVAGCGRHARLVLVLALLLAGGSGWVVATRLGINTDTSRLIAQDLPWRQAEAALDLAFPQRSNLLVAVIESDNADLAANAAERFAEAMRQHGELFMHVATPGSGEFFARSGLLLLPTPELQATADQIVSAQPLLATLAADPTLRGLFGALGLAIEGVSRGDAGLTEFAPVLSGLAQAVETGLNGGPALLPWTSLMTGRPASIDERRRFVLAQPVLDYDALSPGASAGAVMRQLANELHLTPDQGVRLRITGPVALADQELATLSHSMGWSGLLSGALVLAILFLALGSWRLILPILITLVIGLVATAAAAALTVGELNPISIAFGILFVGIGVDFGIQFGVRYRDERHRLQVPAAALRATGAGIGLPLALAAGATMVGFLCFIPTDFRGVSELGIIAGIGMAVAFALNLTVLPALLTLLHPPGEPEAAGFAWAAPVDRWILAHRRLVLAIGALAALVGLAMAPALRFDFNPLNLQDPLTEPVATIKDLAHDPETSPFTIQILAPSITAATALADKLAALPEAARVVTMSSFIPEDQPAKLAILADLRDLLGPSLVPPDTTAPLTDADITGAVTQLQQGLAALPKPDALSRRLSDALTRLAQAPIVRQRAIAASLLTGWPELLGSLRLALGAGPVTLDDIPAALKADWMTADGRTRIEIFPAGDALDNALLVRFVAAVRAVAPEATGDAVTMYESGRTITGAFTQATLIALAAILALLAIALRRARDVALVLAPLLLAGVLTVAVAVAIGLPLNYANVIAVPLLLGIGVSFAIYFVTRWREGLGGPLASATARAVGFSALTTLSAFGSLATTAHPGTAAMGLLLAIALSLTLVTTLFLLPALMGPPPKRPDAGQPAE